MGNSREYLERNREKINAHKRARYDPEVRREKYLSTRESVLEKSKHDKQMCPLCRIDYNRRYLRQHLQCRHRCDASEVEELVSRPATAVASVRRQC